MAQVIRQTWVIQLASVKHIFLSNSSRLHTQKHTQTQSTATNREYKNTKLFFSVFFYFYFAFCYFILSSFVLYVWLKQAKYINTYNASEICICAMPICDK